MGSSERSTASGLQIRVADNVDGARFEAAADGGVIGHQPTKNNRFKSLTAGASEE